MPAAPGRRREQRRPGPHQVGVERRRGRTPPSGTSRGAAALAAQHAPTPSVEVEVVDRAADRLGDPRAGAVEELQQRPVAQRQRLVAVGRRASSRAHLVDVERLGQPPRRRRRLDVAGRRRRPTRPSRAAKRCRPRTALTARAADAADSGGWSASPSRSRARYAGDVALARPRRARRRPAAGQRRRVAVQVAPVRRERVAGQPALDREVVEVGPHDRRHSGQRQLRRRALGQARTSSSFTLRHAVRLGDRAVGDLAVVGVQARARAPRSLRSASRQPWLASSSAYGRVTLVSA